MLETPARSENCRAKLARMAKALRHEEPDRVPISDFFWGSFLKRWRQEFGLGPDTDIYRYYDLDWMQLNPNMDPHIKDFEILEDSDQQVIVRTGFEAVIRKKFDQAMPAFLRFETDTIEKMEAFQFDDPWDERRFFSSGDDQINGVGDGFARNTAPFVDRVKAVHDDFPVFGGVCEAHETLWRIIGSENAMLWIGLYPDEIARFVERLHAFSLADRACADQGCRRAARWHGDLGRRRLQEGHDVLSRFLAEALQAGSQGDCRRVPRSRAAGDLSRLRQREADLR